MSEQNRATDVPEEQGTVAPTDVESAGEPGVAPEGTRDDVEGVENVERDEGPVRRPLIRATLKHPEGTPPPPREAPVFTMHEQPRGGSSSGRGANRGGRSTRDSGHPNKKKNARERSGQQTRKGNSSGGKKHSFRSDRTGQNGAHAGQRSSSSRRDKGRSR